jgi:heme/copper-type cytochrome/quinol oxidase subunit 2
MGLYWFMLIFGVAVVMLVAIVIPWILIAISVETIRERKKNVTKRKKTKEDYKAIIKLIGAMLAILLVAIFLGYASVPYVKDFPYVLESNYLSEEGTIDSVRDVGKDNKNEIEVDGGLYYSTKIKPRHLGRYITFEYLPHTKIIFSYELNNK